jgi:hypothetical protein
MTKAPLECTGKGEFKIQKIELMKLIYTLETYFNLLAGIWFSKHPRLVPIPLKSEKK